MHQIQLPDQIYHQVKRRADLAGFANVDDYVIEMLAYDDIVEENEDLDHLFTPERLAHIDQANAQIKAGQTHTAAQVREHFKKRFGA